MGQYFDAISEDHAEWIKKQKMFIVATAPLDGKGTVNASPKGYDSLRVLGPNEVCYLELSGSGIETQSHLEENGRITIMFMAFEGGPRIMRLLGRGQVLKVNTPAYDQLLQVHYKNTELATSTGLRSIIVVKVKNVGTSCGYGVPFFDYKGPRDTLVNFWTKKTDEDVAEYWIKKNAFSKDGLVGMRHPRMGGKWSTRESQEASESNEGWMSKDLFTFGSTLANASLVLAGVALAAAVNAATRPRRR